MTASEVIVSGNSYFYKNSQFDEELQAVSKTSGIPNVFRWESLTGQKLSEKYDYGKETAVHFSEYWHYNRSAASANSRNVDCGDSFILYRFGAEGGENTIEEQQTGGGRWDS